MSPCSDASAAGAPIASAANPVRDWGRRCASNGRRTSHPRAEQGCGNSSLITTTTLAMRSEAKWRRHVAGRSVLARDVVARFFPFMLGKHRLGVERVDVRGGPVHEQEDDPLGSRVA